MNVDMNMLKEGLVYLNTAIATFKQLKDLLPEGPKKTEAIETLEKAERQLKLAEAQTMKSLGT